MKDQKPTMTYVPELDTNFEIAERTVQTLFDNGESPTILTQFATEAEEAEDRPALLILVMKFVELIVGKAPQSLTELASNVETA